MMTAIISSDSVSPPTGKEASSVKDSLEVTSPGTPIDLRENQRTREFVRSHAVVCLVSDMCSVLYAC